MATSTYRVTGMSCAHCENAVRDEVGEIAGVTGVSVSAETGILVVDTDDVAPADEAVVLAAVEEAGYRAVPSA